MDIGNLIQNGKKIEVRGNKPLSLDKEQCCWFVNKGKVDIFAVIIKNGEPFGHKTHVVRIEQGELIFGIESSDITFQAMGTPETECLEIETKEIFDKLDKNFLSKLIDTWLLKLLKRISSTLRPKTTNEIDIVNNFKIEKEKHFSTKENNLWIEIIQGKINLISEISIKNNFIPLCRYSWVTTLEESIINTYTTNQFIDNNNFLDTFRYFNQLIQNHIKKSIHHLKEYEIKRIKEKTKNKTRILKSSIETIRSVLLPKKSKIIIDDFSGTPLLSACKIIGNCLKIKINPHPDDNSKLENIMRASKVKHRKVILKDDWWNFDSGPMLCYFKDSKIPVPIIPKSPKSYELIDIEKMKK